MFICGAISNVETGDIEEFSEALVAVRIMGSENDYIANVDITEGKVTKLTELPPEGTPDAPPPDYGVEGS